MLQLAGSVFTSAPRKSTHLSRRVGLRSLRRFVAVAGRPGGGAAQRAHFVGAVFGVLLRRLQVSQRALEVRLHVARNQLVAVPYLLTSRPVDLLDEQAAEAAAGGFEPVNRLDQVIRR